MADIKRLNIDADRLEEADLDKVSGTLREVLRGGGDVSSGFSLFIKIGDSQKPIFVENTEELRKLGGRTLSDILGARD